MAFSAVPFVIEAGANEANTMRQAVSTLVPNGGGLVQTGDFPVTQTGTPSMGVSIGAGRAWIPGTYTSNVSGTTWNTQGMYFGLNDGVITRTVAAADPTNPRIDVVAAVVYDAFYTGSTNGGDIIVITGTPNASPAVPGLPYNAIDLAHISVSAGATSIINTNITQTVNKSLNQFGALSHAEFTASNSGPSGTQLPCGALSKVAANSILSTGITATASGQVTVADVGIYAISWMATYPSASGTISYMDIQNTAGTVQYAAMDLVNGSTQTVVSVPNVYIPTANTPINFVYQASFTSGTFNSTVRVTRIR